MAWTFTESFIIDQPIDEVSTTKKFPLGTIVRAQDPTYGAGEFIYLLGVASTVAGSVVTYSPSTYQTELGNIGANIAAPVAFAMAANVASRYGWYQISGVATGFRCGAVCYVAGVRVAAHSTTGKIIASASAAGLDIEGCIVAATASVKSPAVTTVLLSINRPRIQGRVA